MKSFKYSFLMLAVIACNFLQAQQRAHPKPEEMLDKKWNYLVSTSQLTGNEAEKVKPIFMDYEKAIWELHKRNHNTPKEKQKEPNYEEWNEKYIEREVKQAELLQSYHQKLREILSPKTLHHYYRAENSYKRQLIYEMQQNRKNRRQKPEYIRNQQ